MKNKLIVEEYPSLWLVKHQRPSTLFNGVVVFDHYMILKSKNATLDDFSESDFYIPLKDESTEELYPELNSEPIDTLHQIEIPSSLYKIFDLKT